MRCLVTGGSASGKSEYAENFAVELSRGGPLYYIATMEPYGEEADRRISRHRRLREAKGFQTIECYRDIHQALAFTPDPARSTGSAADAEDGSVAPTVLLECLSNLLANEMYAGSALKEEPEALAQRIFRQIQELDQRCSPLVIVTNEIFSDGHRYPPETEAYIQSLGLLNTMLGAWTDQVCEVVCSIPVLLKTAAAAAAFGKGEERCQF